MKVVFTKFPKQELEDDVTFYGLEFQGLGKRFKKEVKRSIERIIEYPSALAVERGDVRKCLLHKFPHKIL